MSRKKIPSQILLGIALIWLTSACGVGSDQNTSVINPDNLQHSWEINIGEIIQEAPIVVKDIAVLIDDAGDIHAFESETGESRWNFETPAKLWPRSLTSTLENVLIAGEDGRLITMTTRSGLAEWELFLDGDVVAPPLIDRYLAFTATSITNTGEDTDQKAEILAINASTGEILWRYSTTNQNLISPARGGDQLYVGGDDSQIGRLYALSAAEGELRWKYEVPEDVIKALHANDEVVVILDHQGTMTALNGNSGSQLWRSEFVANATWLMGTKDLVIFEDGSSLKAWNINSGKPVWEYSIPNKIVDQPIIQDSALFLLTQSGEIINLDPQTGAETWVFQSESKSPIGMVVASNQIFIADKDGILYAYVSEE